MAYRRRQGMTRASTFKEEIHYPLDHNDNFSSLSSSASFTSSSSLAAQAIRASAAHRDSSLSEFRDSDPSRSKLADYEDMSTTNTSKSGFWGVLARKAKAILDDDNVSPHFETAERTRSQFSDTTSGGQFQQSYQSPESIRKMDNPTLRKGLDALTTSLNHIGDTFEKAFEEGRTIVESKTADIIQETRKLQIRRKRFGPEGQTQAIDENNSLQFQNNHQTQLKASRDVAMATAAKAKLLLRELKTVKADLAFAKERSAQLEEENKILRESRQKGDNPADDDLIRLQLETLLAEKARLAHENSIYARENRFLREIVEYHQLTMQDVVYLDEGIEEVTEVHPLSAVTRMLSISPPSPSSPRLSADIAESANLLVTKEVLTIPNMPQRVNDDLGVEVRLSSRSSVHDEEVLKGPLVPSV